MVEDFHDRTLQRPLVGGSLAQPGEMASSWNREHLKAFADLASRVVLRVPMWLHPLTPLMLPLSSLWCWSDPALSNFRHNITVQAEGGVPEVTAATPGSPSISRLRAIALPADGVKGKTWGPSSANNAVKVRPTIVDDPSGRWSQSAPSLEKSPRNMGMKPSVNSLPENDYDESDHRPLIPLQYQEAGVPMPTLYNESGTGNRGQEGRPRMGAIHMLLYNMSSMLAGVATGYDVRLSNVTAFHPKLHPKRPQEGEDEHNYWFGDPAHQAQQPVLYPHNTYHGHTPHLRTPLNNVDFKPLRFTDSPQNFGPVPGSTNGLRRRPSNTSTEGSMEVVQYPPPPPVATGPGLDRPLFTPSPDYGESGYGTGRARKYHPDQMEDPQGYPSNVATNRTYGLTEDQPVVRRKDSIDRVLDGSLTPSQGRSAKDGLGSRHNSQMAPTANMYDPGPARTARYATTSAGSSQLGHRRSSSNSSMPNAIFGSGHRMGSHDPEDRDLSWGSASGDYDQSHQRLPSMSSNAGAPVRRLSRQNSYGSRVPGNTTEVERPQTLELPMTPRTPLRSSLKKTTYSYQTPGTSSTTSGRNNWPTSGGGGSSENGTPTHPTPPDSLSEESFVKSDSGFISTTRVRFSPSPFEKGVYVTDWSPTHTEPSAQPPSSLHSHHTPLQRRRSGGSGSGHAPTSSHYVTDTDLHRDFNFYSKS